MQKTTLFVSLLLTAALAGCGGNGGSSGGGRASLGSTAAPSSSSTGAITSKTNPPVVSTPTSTTGGSTTVVSTPTSTTGGSTTGGSTTGGSTTGGSGGSGSTSSSGSLTLTVTQPVRGAQLPAGTTMVKGNAKGASVVTVNGTPVTPNANGDFVASVKLVEGSNPIQVIAADRSGNKTDTTIGVLAGDFLAPGMNVRDAATARITNEALRKAAPVAAAMLDQNLKTMKGQTLGKWAVNALGRTITTQVDIDDIRVTSTDVAIEAQPAGLHGALTARGFQADLTVAVDAGSFFGQKLGLKHTLDIHFDKLAAEGLLDLAVTNGQLTVDTGHLKLAYSPTVLASMIGQSNLNAINGALGAIGSVIGQNLKIDEVAIVNKLLDKAWNMGLKKTADDQIATMIVQTGVKGVPVQAGGYNATATYKVTRFSTDTTGFTIVNDLDVKLALADVHASKGSLVSSGAAPTLTGSTGVKIALNEDTLNRILEEGWRKGQLDLVLDKTFTGGPAPKLHLTFTAKDLALLMPALNAFIPAGSGIELKLSPKAAPVVKLAANGNATFELTDMQVELGIETPGGGHVKLLVLDVNLKAPVTFSLVGTTTRALKVNVGTPSFEFDLTDAIVKGLPKLPIETALKVILPPVVQFAGSHFLGPVPLPAMGVAGLKPTPDKITTDGAKGTFLRTDISVR